MPRRTTCPVRPRRGATVIPLLLSLLAAFSASWILARAITAPGPRAELHEVAESPTNAVVIASDDHRRPPSPFTTWRVEIETPEPVALGAWQVRIDLRGATVVGIEGGSVACFTDPPLYDPAALADGDLVLMAFTVDCADPEARLQAHVATLHVRIDDAAAAHAELTLVAAADRDGTPIAANATLVRRDDR